MRPVDPDQGGQPRWWGWFSDEAFGIRSGGDVQDPLAMRQAGIVTVAAHTRYRYRSSSGLGE